MREGEEAPDTMLRDAYEARGDLVPVVAEPMSNFIRGEPSGPDVAEPNSETELAEGGT